MSQGDSVYESEIWISKAKHVKKKKKTNPNLPLASLHKLLNLRWQDKVSNFEAMKPANTTFIKDLLGKMKAEIVEWTATVPSNKSYLGSWPQVFVKEAGYGCVLKTVTASQTCTLFKITLPHGRQLPKLKLPGEEKKKLFFGTKLFDSRRKELHLAKREKRKDPNVQTLERVHWLKHWAHDPREKMSAS